MLYSLGVDLQGNERTLVVAVQGNGRTLVVAIEGRKKFGRSIKRKLNGFFNLLLIVKNC